ncbi:kinase-like domain-containing protein [Mycena pura]|uniref:Kinase-like domain-containing protein n=1 Tax=Mycena pura TaxID=153505 RepID=A0AAD6VI14_9AGAR|nr:kinase-like domain-containing protein [Mycena pura]
MDWAVRPCKLEKEYQGRCVISKIPRGPQLIHAGRATEVCDKLPSSLFISGVTGRHEHALFGGGFGDIYQASHAGKTVALKHIRAFHRDAEQHRFCREALVWQRLRHPFVLEFNASIDRESFPGSLCLVAPWMENGTALSYLKDHGKANVDKLLFEVAQGMQYLHSQNIVHGDLRGANILITHDWHACLADFGLARFSDATVATHTSHRAGSIRWMAPELIDPGLFKMQFLRTPASDVYAFGCMCLELYTGRPPFIGLSETAAMLQVIRGGRPDRPTQEEQAMTAALWQFVNECWEQTSASRPSSKDVVERLHPKVDLT